MGISSIRRHYPDPMYGAAPPPRDITQAEHNEALEAQRRTLRQERDRETGLILSKHAQEVERYRARIAELEAKHNEHPSKPGQQPTTEDELTHNLAVRVRELETKHNEPPMDVPGTRYGGDDPRVTHPEADPTKSFTQVRKETGTQEQGLPPGARMGDSDPTAGHPELRPGWRGNVPETIPGGPMANPLTGPDGKPLPLGPDGKPIGPDGKPLPLGPDGKPLQTTGPDGKPIETDPDGKPLQPGTQPQKHGATQDATRTEQLPTPSQAIQEKAAEEKRRKGR